MPRAKATTYRIHSSSWPVATTNASSPMTSIRAASTRTIVRRRSSRSASAPAGSEKSSHGKPADECDRGERLRVSRDRPVPRAGGRSGRCRRRGWRAPIPSADARNSGSRPLIESSQSIMMLSMARRGPPSPKPTERREATPAEFKAMAHPLRLRILRLCLHDALTNKEIADRLGQDPATTLHHVRTLCATGFLSAEPPRTGKRGALEKPYRATRKVVDPLRPRRGRSGDEHPRGHRCPARRAHRRRPRRDRRQHPSRPAPLARRGR